MIIFNRYLQSQTEFFMLISVIYQPCINNYNNIIFTVNYDYLSSLRIDSHQGVQSE